MGVALPLSVVSSIIMDAGEVLPAGITASNKAEAAGPPFLLPKSVATKKKVLVGGSQVPTCFPFQWEIQSLEPSLAMPTTSPCV